MMRALLAYAFSGLFFAASAWAECGGTVNCIAVGATPADALVAHHPAPDLGTATFTLTFAVQNTGTTSASQTVNVAAVTGPAGTMAQLGVITITGANAAEFSITGGSCSPVNGPVHGGAQCTVTVAFNPFTAGAKSALLNVPLSAPGCVGCISGRSVALAGTGVGAPVAAPRPDPSRDATVVGTLRAQAQSAQRFARAQISNFQRRMESLHAGAADRQALPAGSRRASLDDRLVSALSTGSLNVSASGGAGAPARLGGGTTLWTEGDLIFGSRAERSDSAGSRFTTQGISFGADHRFTDRLALGLGVGLARDETDIGADGSENRAKGRSIALYGSYLPAAKIFVDALVGYGALDLDTERFVATAGDFARANRKGNQLFGSLAAGYEHRNEGLLIAPYAKVDFTQSRLKEATETASGANALTYAKQELRSQQLALGVRAESLHETSFGWAVPRARVELAHDSNGDGAASITYADQFAGPTYSVSPLEGKKSSLLLGVGSDFLFRNGFKLGVDYQHQRLPGADSHQAIRLWLAHDLGGRPTRPGAAYSSRTFADPVRVEAGYTYDDNVNRAPDSGPKLSDHIYSLNANKSMAASLTSRLRAVFNGFLNGEKFYDNDGLDRFSAGVRGELQFRTSGAFSAPTFGVFVRSSVDDYHSELRSGHRHTLGTTLRMPVTDRIDLFGSLTRSERSANNPVFDAKDGAGRLQLDYSIGRSGTLYGAGEYRRGDTVSTAGPGFDTAVRTKASVRDDAYHRTLTAYRYEATTVIWTLGYNWPLGSRDSLDVSARRAESKPREQLAGGGLYASGGSTRYTANQLSAAYLMRF